MKITAVSRRKMTPNTDTEIMKLCHLYKQRVWEGEWGKTNTLAAGILSRSNTMEYILTNISGNYLP